MLADAVHASGALIGVELNHAGRVANAAVSGRQPVAPSPVPFDGDPPRELAPAEIDAIVEAYADAARRCVRAGVDVLELHAAHGYLIAQFLSPRTNRRADGYADPVRFANEVITAVRDAAPRIPLFLRISAFEGVEGGLDAGATRALVGGLRLDLVDVIDVSAGCYEAGEWIVQPGETRRAVLAPFAREYRRFGKVVAVAGRITTGADAESVLRDGHADLVTVGRALHADPEWSHKVLRGVAPRPCIACNQGCIDQLHRQQPIWCVVNPATGDEGRLVRPPRERRRVVVVGGGVAGLEAARVCAERGHHVTLLEAADQLGGEFRLASTLDSRPEFARLLDWYTTELARLEVDVRRSTRADAGLVRTLAPDVVVVATGGTGLVPAVAGIDLPRVTDVRDWLARRPALGRDEVVTVWGADRAGLATADAVLAAGHPLVLLTAQAELAPEAGPREKGPAVRRVLSNPAATVRLRTTVEEVEPDRVLVGHAGEQTWLAGAGPFLVSQGIVPNVPDLGTGPWETHLIREVDSAASAISQAATTAASID